MNRQILFFTADQNERTHKPRRLSHLPRELIYIHIRLNVVEVLFPLFCLQNETKKIAKS